MQTFNLNVESSSVSDTTVEPQKPLLVIIGEDLGLEAIISNVDSPSVPAGEPRKPPGMITDEGFGLEIVGNEVSYGQSQVVEVKADIVQSNTSRISLSSPICRLPTEILSEIFLYCLPEDEHLLYTSRLAPMLLTTICRRWREVAVGLPMLWCRLQLRVGYNNWQQRAFCYDSWLKRSGECPLSLSLRCRTDWRELQTMLQPYVRRISSLSLIILSCNSPFMMEDFDALKELTIHQYIPYHSARAINPTLSTLPVNLRRINMQDIWFDRKLLDVFTDFAWARLTHIEISIDGLDAFTRLLRLCPNLSHLKMNAVFYPIQLPEPVTHTNLQSLCVSWDANWNLSGELDLFKVITLPNLRVLEVCHTGLWPHESFMEFLTRSKYPLERLIFDSAAWTTDRERAEYATLIPSFELKADAESEFDVDEE